MNKIKDELNKIYLEVEILDRNLFEKEMGTHGKLKAGVIIQIPGGGNIFVQGLIPRRTQISSDLLELVIDFGSGTSAGFLANWLYNRLKGKATIIRTKRTEIEIRREDIERILIEETEQNLKLEVASGHESRDKKILGNK